MNHKKDKAKEFFNNQYNCAQTVLKVFCQEVGLDSETALKMMTGFGGGVSRNQEICGAVAGGVSLLGYKFGHGTPPDTQAVTATYQKVQQLIDVIREIHGSCLCRELIAGIDLKTPQGLEAFKEKGLKETVCLPCIDTVIDQLELLLKEG